MYIKIFIYKFYKFINFSYLKSNVSLLNFSFNHLNYSLTKTSPCWNIFGFFFKIYQFLLTQKTQSFFLLIELNSIITIYTIILQSVYYLFIYIYFLVLLQYFIMFFRNFNFLKRFYAEVKTIAEFQQARQGKEHYVVQFSAAWCNPCKQLAPVLYKKQQQSQGAWTIIKVDVDEQGNCQLCHKYGLKEVPTLLFFKKDKQVQKLVGNQTEEALDQAIVNLLKA